MMALQANSKHADTFSPNAKLSFYFFSVFDLHIINRLKETLRLLINVITSISIKQIIERRHS